MSFSLQSCCYAEQDLICNHSLHNRNLLTSIITHHIIQSSPHSWEIKNQFQVTSPFDTFAIPTKSKSFFIRGDSTIKPIFEGSSLNKVVKTKSIPPGATRNPFEVKEGKITIAPLPNKKKRKRSQSCAKYKTYINEFSECITELTVVSSTSSFRSCASSFYEENEKIDDLISSISSSSFFFERNEDLFIDTFMDLLYQTNRSMDCSKFKKIEFSPPNFKPLRETHYNFLGCEKCCKRMKLFELNEDEFKLFPDTYCLDGKETLKVFHNKRMQSNQKLIRTKTSTSLWTTLSDPKKFLDSITKKLKSNKKKKRNFHEINPSSIFDTNKKNETKRNTSRSNKKRKRKKKSKLFSAIGKRCKRLINKKKEKKIDFSGVLRDAVRQIKKKSSDARHNERKFVRFCSKVSITISKFSSWLRKVSGSMNCCLEDEYVF